MKFLFIGKKQKEHDERCEQVAEEHLLHGGQVPRKPHEEVHASKSRRRAENIQNADPAIFFHDFSLCNNFILRFSKPYDRLVCRLFHRRVFGRGGGADGNGIKAALFCACYALQNVLEHGALRGRYVQTLCREQIHIGKFFSPRLPRDGIGGEVAFHALPSETGEKEFGRAGSGDPEFDSFAEKSFQIVRRALLQADAERVLLRDHGEPLFYDLIAGLGEMIFCFGVDGGVFEVHRLDRIEIICGHGEAALCEEAHVHVRPCVKGIEQGAVEVEDRAFDVFRKFHENIIGKKGENVKPKNFTNAKPCGKIWA